VKPFRVDIAPHSLPAWQAFMDELEKSGGVTI
jgi:hypothetical protein